MTEDHSYFYERAEQELDMAQRAAKPEAVRAHYDLANRYLERVFPSEGDASRAVNRHEE